MLAVRTSKERLAGKPDRTGRQSDLANVTGPRQRPSDASRCNTTATNIAALKEKAQELIETSDALDKLCQALAAPAAVPAEARR